MSAGSGGLSQPRQGVFGPDGNFYVASQGNGQVLRYNGATGAFMNTFATTGTTQGPMWLEFGTDGFLYTTARTTANSLNTSIIRFNSTTGTLVDSLAIGRDSWSFIVSPNNTIYYSGNGGANYVERYGSSSIAAFKVSLSEPSLDPSNPAHIWIVDSGTDRVYQYDNAVGLTSGSKSANSSWALAAGNTNPQGIADPPPSSFGSMGKIADLQLPFAGAAPMPLLIRASDNVGSVSLQQVQTKVRSTDDFMSVLGLVSEQPKASVSGNGMTPIVSVQTIDRISGIEAEMQLVGIDELIGLVATDLSRPVHAPRLH